VTVLLTGATGYVGGKLLDALLDRNVPVRALTRDVSRLAARAGLEVAAGNVSDAASLAGAFDGVGVAYYLVHSLGAENYAETDRDAARTFGAAALAAGVERIVYLGGIGHGELSPHLESRQEVGKILRESGVPTVELRASIVIGAGSVSFDAFTTLVDTLPLTVLPDWARTPSQPIAVDDVVAYLLEAAKLELDGSEVFEIGGSDRVPYTAILEEYARQSGAPRAIATVPAPGALSTVATALKPLQPERARIVSDLFDSLRIDTSVQDDRANDRFTVRPRGLTDAIAATL
jgi:uncharacterized protein YbjT (DUF2867 family)